MYRDVGAKRICRADKQSVRRGDQGADAVVKRVAKSVGGDGQPNLAVARTPQGAAAELFREQLDAIAIHDAFHALGKFLRRKILHHTGSRKRSGVEPAVMHTHAPDVGVKWVVESGAHAAERKFEPLFGDTSLTHHQLPRVVGKHPQQFGGGGTETVVAIVSAVDNRNAEIQGPAKFLHAAHGLVVAAATATTGEHPLPAASGKILAVGFPQLETVRIHRAGIKETVENGHLENALVVGIAKIGLVALLPRGAGGIVGSHNHRGAGRAARAGFSRRGDPQTAFIIHHRAERVEPLGGGSGQT